MKSIAITGVALLATATFAMAQEESADEGATFTVPSGFYVSARIGANLLKDLQITDQYATRHEYTYKPGMVFAGAAGYKLPFFRAEFEVEYAVNGQDEYTLTDAGGRSFSFGASGDWYALSEFVNVYLDIDNPTGFTPFLFAGAGLTNFGYDDITITRNGASAIRPDDSDTVFAWKLGAGVAWNFMDNIFLDLTYRYLKTDTTGGYSHTSHAATLGGRYRF